MDMTPKSYNLTACQMINPLLCIINFPCFEYSFFKGLKSMLTCLLHCHFAITTNKVHGKEVEKSLSL